MSDDGLQDPPDLDNLHAPEEVNVRCARCGGVHPAYLDRYVPLGAESRDADPKVQLIYKMPECTAEPLPGPGVTGNLEATPRVWHDREDGT
jgi:hypothetical protein